MGDVVPWGLYYMWSIRPFAEGKGTVTIEYIIC